MLFFSWREAVHELETRAPKYRESTELQKCGHFQEKNVRFCLKNTRLGTDGMDMDEDRWTCL